MISPFNFKPPEKPIYEFAILDPLNENTELSYDQIFTEAVFVDGKKQMDPIVKAFGAIKELLNISILKQKESNDKKKFDPKVFWRDKNFKDLEDAIQKVFGFRSVRIQPYIEKYNSDDDNFESKELNAYTYPSDRYPIDGLVSDKGFYDKTHSIFMDVYISLGIIRSLEPEELTAILLHEFGHNIDPVLVDIKYMETNILSKYLSDRQGSINKNENRFIKEKKIGEHTFIGIILLAVMFIPSIINFIYEKIVGKEKIEQKKIQKIVELVKKDKDKFDRKNASEAFADNFARMYGYAAPLMSGLRKISKSIDNEISLIKSERQRREIIVRITELTIKDEHKTDMHRINNLIREYKEDLKDPNIPAKVKESIKADLKELETVVDQYTNDFSSFQNRVNKAIIDELQKKDAREERKDQRDKKEEEIKESFEFFEESKKAYEELMKRKETVTSAERAQFYKKFGNSKECSLAKDDKGYYVYTHRCRSKSYPSIDDIPQKDVDFVRSTA